MVRVVVYAEGSGEAAGEVMQLPPVGDPLREDMLGAAHVLVRRTLADAQGIDATTVRFDSPKRTRRGIPRGSDLHHGSTLRALLTWTRSPETQPDLAVVLVDSDGNRQRATQLRTAIVGVRITVVIGMPIEEFEAWLVADADAVAKVLGGSTSAPSPSDPEALPPTEAKRLLTDWLGERAKGLEGRKLRRSIAEECALEVLRQRCRAFERFQKDLRSLKA